MDFSTSITEFTGANRNWRYTMDRISISVWPSRAPAQDRGRSNAHQALRMKKKAGPGRIGRQQPQRTRVSGNRHVEAFTAIVAVTMLPYVPFGKPLAALDSRFAKYILLPTRQSKMDDRPVTMGLRPSSPVERRLLCARDDPCLFRTRLIDPMATDADAEIAFESTDMLDSDDLKFDDTQCISVGRSMGKFKAMPGTVSDPTAAYRTILIHDKDDGDDDKDDDGSMEAMNMPFWYLPLKRQKSHTHHAGDPVPDDDMSIISDASLIPTYYPSDIMKQQQQQQRPQHRAIIKRVIRAKARAAKQTMRELKRSCRDAVEHVLVESAASHRAPKCVAVGSAY
ncbi:hypothetical protein C8A01DRAFT_15621 [Parachaetomium inaequale]|uniref:Uncharacterized protein n=1 Tax=Parachaetomium inaequale TaxID=2588326 RepID=A0AAN6PI52_9PEZI|nr:hypothetical protein C8A01DRAFT_15621 [Parachaetomium inaequale]